jgi:hypothetical protein
MDNTFYIFAHEHLEGPYDLLSMIRKIKNGRLTRDSLITLDPQDAPAPAAQYPLLLEVIVDQEEVNAMATAEPDAGISLFSALRGGWDVFQLNQTTAILTGIFALAALFGVMFFSIIPHPVAQGIISAVWSYFVFNLYLVALSRKARMQLVHNEFYFWLLKKWKPLLLASVLGSIVPGILPAILFPIVGPPALFLVFIPGLLVVSYLLFLPLIIVDRSVGLKEALAINARKLNEAGVDFYSVIFGLVATNIIPLFPVTMPVTLGAACECYDRVYNEY